MNVVISQPMYMPWCGLINQIKFCDVFVHYDDVQLSRGFYNRVQVKKESGTELITIPLKSKAQKVLISDAKIFNHEDWQSKHKLALENSFKNSPFKSEAISLFERIHQHKYESLSELCINSTMVIAEYFNLTTGKKFLRSSELGLAGSGSQRLLDITKKVGGKVYITGLGALNYLNHEIFEDAEISVNYMKYSIHPYSQPYGEFTPYLTSLDAVANLGRSAPAVLGSSLVDWRWAVAHKSSLISGDHG